MPRANISLYRAVSDQSTSLMLACSLVHLQDPNNLLNVITNGFELDVKPSFFPTGLPLRDRNPVEQRCTGVSKSCPAAPQSLKRQLASPNLIVPRKFDELWAPSFKYFPTYGKISFHSKSASVGSPLSEDDEAAIQMNTAMKRARKRSSVPKLQQRFFHT